MLQSCKPLFVECAAKAAQPAFLHCGACTGHAQHTENRTAIVAPCRADCRFASIMMQATAVIERIRRAISETSDSVNARLQPISSAFGKAFKVDDWAVDLFAEEVVRGGPAFAVSLILSAMEPGFRAAAELGAWQLISPVNVTGKVLVVANLHEVQDKVLMLHPSVLWSSWSAMLSGFQATEPEGLYSCVDLGCCHVREAIA